MDFPFCVRQTRIYELHQRAAKALLTAKLEDPQAATTAVTFYTAVMEWCTPDTWPSMYSEAHRALQEAQAIIHQMQESDGQEADDQEMAG